MRTSILFAIAALMSVPVIGAPVQKEIFGMSAAGFHVMRYDVIGGTFLDCGAIATSNFSTNLAMDNNRRLYYMNPFEGLHTIWQADLDGSNQLINQQVLDTLQPGLDIIDGFTIGPDQNLYMTGYGHSEIYRYDIGSYSGTANTEVTLTGGGEFRSDLAFDPLTGYLVGIGIVPDGTGRRSLFQVPGSIATNGVNDIYAWEYYGGNSSPWASIDLGSPTNPLGPLGPNPDGVAFDPTNGDLYLSGDGENFSIWNRSTAVLVNYLPIGGPDTGLGFDLAFQTVPEPGALVLLGLGGLMVGWRRR
jgi:hypothetical protein